VASRKPSVTDPATAGDLRLRPRLFRLGHFRL
jgi:hypothetical protein